MIKYKHCIATWALGIFGVLAAFYAFRLIGVIAQAAVTP